VNWLCKLIGHKIRHSGKILYCERCGWAKHNPTSPPAGVTDHDELTGVSPNDHHGRDHASRHADGATDEISAEDLATSLADGKILQASGGTFVSANKGMSVIDFFDYGGLYFHSLFESLDGWYQITSGSGSVGLTYGRYLDLDTGATSGSEAGVSKRPQYPICGPPTWGKDRRLRTYVHFQNVQTGASDVAWMISGETGTSEHIGFKVIGGTLYGTVADGTAESTLSIQTVANGDDLLLEVVFTSGTEAEFFVDGVSQGTLSSNLPTGTGYALNIVKFYVYNGSTAANYIIYPSEVKALQEA